jgi:hypothetical protein
MASLVGPAKPLGGKMLYVIPVSPHTQSAGQALRVSLVQPGAYTISLKLECMNGFHQIRIAGQRGDHRGGVALHQACHMRLQGGEA